MLAYAIVEHGRKCREVAFHGRDRRLHWLLFALRDIEGFAALFHNLANQLRPGGFRVVGRGALVKLVQVKPIQIGLKNGQRGQVARDRFKSVMNSRRRMCPLRTSLTAKYPA